MDPMSDLDDIETPYEATTRGIKVAVRPVFLPDQSDPQDRQYVWAYQVQIENAGGQTVQLRTRHWQITDSNGVTQDVRGPGVVGEEPVLEPGERFEYVSAAPLPTPSGLMRGTYGMETIDGEHFDALIPAFSLDSPYEDRKPS